MEKDWIVTYKINRISMALMASNLVVALPIFIAIHRYISRKSLISITLVDLIYCDTLVYIYLLCFTLTIAFIHCLLQLEAELTLDFVMARIYSVIGEFIIFCLTVSLIVSGVLRLISIVQNSEAAGIQLLGPENIAIVKIRILSITLAVLFELIVTVHLKTYSGLFYMFHDPESTSILNSVNKNNYAILFQIQPVLAFLINVIIKLYVFWINRKIEQNQLAVAFTIQNFAFHTTTLKKGFSLPLGSVVGIPVIVLLGTIFTFANRKIRVTFLGPLQLTFMLIVVPGFIINRNKKMRAFFFENWIYPARDRITENLYKFNKRTNVISPFIS
jgi:hypothetical protein